MAEERPMTVKERMAALAQASSGSSSATPPGPPKTSTPSPGGSVAERLARMRRGTSGGSTGENGESAAASSSEGGRVMVPATDGFSKSEGSFIAGSRSGGNSIAHRIAKLSAGGSSQSSIPDSQSPADFSPAMARASSTQSDEKPPLDRPSSTKSISSMGLSSELDSLARKDEEGSSPSRSRDTADSSGRISPGVVARMQAMGVGAHSTEESSKAGNDQGPPPPPSVTPGSSTSRMSPGLAARMQALGSSGVAPDAADEGVEGGNKGGPRKAGGVGLPGMAIPLPGIMGPGGLSELRRRKQNGDQGEVPADPADQEDPLSRVPKDDVKPGELKHANLSRATMPQRRRRKSSRPFQGAAGSSNKSITARIKSDTPLEEAASEDGGGDPGRPLHDSPSEESKEYPPNSAINSSSIESTIATGDVDEWETS